MKRIAQNDPHAATHTRMQRLKAREFPSVFILRKPPTTHKQKDAQSYDGNKDYGGDDKQQSKQVVAHPSGVRPDSIVHTDYLSANYDPILVASGLGAGLADEHTQHDL
ncbi:MAG: hypothetical protein ABR577_08310 [Pyrinomonadaceae bacterium]